MPQDDFTASAKLISAGAFEIDSVAPPDGARPIGGGYEFVEPESTAVNGLGQAIGIVGKPKLHIRFPKMTQVAWNWWVALVGTSKSVAISTIQFWNPYKPGGAGYTIWTGGAILHQPTYGSIKFGLFEDVEIWITHMEP